MIWLLAITIFQGAAYADVLMRVRPHVVVAPLSEVKLAQLVDGENLSPAARHDLEKITLSVAPEYGEQQEIANANLTELLRPIVQAERVRQSTRVHLVLPRTVVVDTIKREITAEQVTSELLQAWQPMCSDCKLEIEALSVPQVSQIKDWSLKLKAELPKGGFSVPVQIIKENGAPVSAWVNGRLITKRQVPVAKKMLGLGERVQPEDVNFEYRDVTFSLDGIPTADDLVGKRLRQGLRAGEVVWMSRLEKERAIRRGDVVTVRTSEARFEVSINMVAQQDGFIGDTVNLKNPKTNLQLVGQVVGQGEVELR